MPRSPRILIIDLQNFARYPSLGVGVMVALLRREGYLVEVLSPLALGVSGPPRERPEGWKDQLERRLEWSTRPALVRGRRWLGRWRRRRRERHAMSVARWLEERLRRDRADLVLASTYLEYLPLCRRVAEIASERGVPFLVGGAMFTMEETARAWARIPGVTAVVAGEAEAVLSPLVQRALAGQDLGAIPGVHLADGRRGPIAAPLTDLEAAPFPDFGDFPWDCYPTPVVPLMAGRGCGWGACTFCSDIVTSSGRSFRSRTAEHVLAEMTAQGERHGARDFILLDLKLNSDLELWRGLHQGLPRAIPDARWLCAVHVDGREDNGLDPESLRAARAAGLRRLTTGLEFGSQSVLDAYDKGTRLERSERFLQDAASAGIGVRATIIVGAPEETPEDVEATAALLERHEAHVERVRLSRLGIYPRTRLARRADRDPRLLPLNADPLTGRHELAPLASDPRHQRAVHRVLNAVHRINRKRLPADLRDLDGLM